MFWVRKMTVVAGVALVASFVARVSSECRPAFLSRTSSYPQYTSDSTSVERERREEK